jgi:hypothetical protein
MEILRLKDSLYSCGANIGVESKLLGTLFSAIAVTTDLLNNFSNLIRRTFS